MQKSNPFIPSALNLFALLIALPMADALAESYDPVWAMIQPKRTMRVVAESGASDTSNGERLRKAMEALEPGDQLEIGTGTYNVDRL